MAYSLVRASSQYISAADFSSGIEAPFTISGWCNSSDISNTQNLIVLHDGGNPTDRHGIVLRGAVAGDPIDASSTTNDGGVPSGGALTTSGYSQNTWFNGTGVFSATNSRTIYINATSSATNTTNVPITGIVKTFLGCTYSAGAAVGFLDGRLAECAIWSAALTADEVNSLSKGFKPTRVRPQSLIFYAPLVRNLQELRQGRALTNNNTATVGNHTRVY